MSAFFTRFLSKKNKQTKEHKFDFLCHSVSLIGGRDENQDFVIQKTIKDSHCMVLADGMGGHSGGSLASKLFCESLISQIEKNIYQLFTHPKKFITKLVSNSRKQMLDEVKAIDPSLNPGTTFVATVIGIDELITAHLGDSRCLVVDQKEILSLTKDHSMAQFYLDEGIINEDQMINHPAQSRLLKAISNQINDDPDIKVIRLNTVAFPVYVIQMSDGFWQGISNSKLMDEIKRLENNLDKFNEIIDNLAQQAVDLTSPDSDNVTLQVCRILKINI